MQGGKTWEARLWEKARTNQRRWWRGTSTSTDLLEAKKGNPLAHHPIFLFFPSPHANNLNNYLGRYLLRVCSTKLLRTRELGKDD